MVALADGRFMNDEESRLTLLSWSSWKLQRVTRSSSGAEVQAASEAQEEAEYCRLVVAEVLCGRMQMTKAWAGHARQVPSCLVTDCRGVYDALEKSESSGVGLKDKRAGLEALALRQSMALTGTALRWCHSHAQLADMMTKLNSSTTATWEYFLKRGSWRLIYDPDFESAKKRAKRGLQILSEDTGYIINSEAEAPASSAELVGHQRPVFTIACLDDRDAWVCAFPLLKAWTTSLEESNSKQTFAVPELAWRIRAAYEGD